MTEELTPETKRFLQIVGRYVAKYTKEHLLPLQIQIDQLKGNVRELQSRIRELEIDGAKYCGVYQRAMSYKRGAMVTHNDLTWVVVADEVLPMEIPGRSNSWQLCEKSKRGVDAGANAA